jgi:hypothetical protein
MKKSILAAVAVSAMIGSFSPQAFAQRIIRNRNQERCNCQELERRLRGLEYVVRNERLDYREQQDIQQQINRGQSYLSQVDVNRDSAQRQDSVCSQGAQAVAYAWGRWQPELARMGVDRDIYCVDDNSNQGPDIDVPYDGDEGCPRGLWKTEDRCLAGIDLREGRNNRYMFKTQYMQMSRCWRYVCKEEYSGICH